MEKFQKFVHNKDGSSSIELVIGMLIFLVVLMFAVDLMRISLGFAVLSQAVTETARIASVQGGFSGKPAHFPGKYITATQMRSIVGDKLASAGVSQSNFHLTLPGKVRYRDELEVVGTIDYEWSIIQSIFGRSMGGSITSRRLGMGEWKHDYTNWDGEGF